MSRNDDSCMFSFPVAMKVEIAIGENLDDTGSVVLMFDDSEFFVCNSNEQIDSWIWMFNNNAALPEETVSIVLPDNRALLFIRNVTENHRGTFTCIGRLGNRSLSDSVTVDVGECSTIIFIINNYNYFQR